MSLAKRYEIFLYSINGKTKQKTIKSALTVYLMLITFLQELMRATIIIIIIIINKQIYKLHQDEKKRKYASRIIEVENGTFTPLVFTTCLRSVSCSIPG